MLIGSIHQGQYITKSRSRHFGVSSIMALLNLLWSRMLFIYVDLKNKIIHLISMFGFSDIHVQASSCNLDLLLCYNFV